jgi:hypothetical protein
MFLFRYWPMGLCLASRLTIGLGWATRLETASDPIDFGRALANFSPHRGV